LIEDEDQGSFIDVGCILVVLGRTTGEKVHLVGKDFAAITFDFVGIFPLRIMQAPFDRNHLALGAILGNIENGGAKVGHGSGGMSLLRAV
jgi:hypothetical protein